MTKHSLLNTVVHVPLNTPGSATTSVVNSDYVGLKHGSCVKFTVLVEEGRAAQADDNTLTLRQAKTAGGGDVKAFVPRRAYRRAHATDIAAAAAAARRDISGSAMHIDGNETTIYEVEVDASELDLDDDFKFLQVRTAAVTSSTTQVTMSADVGGLRQKTAPEHLPNVLA